MSKDGLQERTGIRFTFSSQPMQFLLHTLANFFPAAIAGWIAIFVIIHFDGEVIYFGISPVVGNCKIEKFRNVSYSDL
jgi:hypothetical protein